MVKSTVVSLTEPTFSVGLSCFEPGRSFLLQCLYLLVIWSGNSAVTSWYYGCVWSTSRNGGAPGTGMVERRDTSLDKEVGLSPHNSVRLFLPVNLAGADREERRFAPGPAE
jgi:hypothetical protein